MGGRGGSSGPLCICFSRNFRHLFGQRPFAKSQNSEPAMGCQNDGRSGMARSQKSAHTYHAQLSIYPTYSIT